MAETHIMKDDQTPTWTAGTTAERGTCTETGLHPIMKERDLREIAIKATGNTFSFGWFDTHIFPNFLDVCRLFNIVFCLFLIQAHSPWLKKGISNCDSLCVGFKQKFCRDIETQSSSLFVSRHPLGPPPRSSYRERERDIRDREESGNRDRDDHYGRPGYDRTPYERTSLERSGSDRYGHSSSPYSAYSPPSITKKLFDVYHSFVLVKV